MASVARAFEIAGEFRGAAPVTRGHIHDSYAIEYAKGSARERYLLQRLNTGVFRDPEALMRNVALVTEHVRAKLRARGVLDPARRCLTLIPARGGATHHVDAEGDYWRTFRFIEAAKTVDRVGSRKQARQVARLFGAFAEMLADLERPPADTIPDFHDLAKRFASFEVAVRDDVRARAGEIRAEIECARERFASICEALERHGFRELPRRVVHNDCKINNAMLDRRSGEALCVIDLDTVMQGTVLCDFGELVRTASCRSAEDELRLTAMRFEPELFGAVARGYLEGAAHLLGEAELRLLPLAGPLLTLENAIRFLTDHLSGDVYFRIHREGHNLDRARTQLRLLELLEENLEAAREALARAARDLLPKTRR